MVESDEKGKKEGKNRRKRLTGEAGEENAKCYFYSVRTPPLVSLFLEIDRARRSAIFLGRGASRRDFIFRIFLSALRCFLPREVCHGGLRILEVLWKHLHRQSFSSSSSVIFVFIDVGSSFAIKVRKKKRKTDDKESHTFSKLAPSLFPYSHHLACLHFFSPLSVRNTFTCAHNITARKECPGLRFERQPQAEGHFRSYCLADVPVRKEY